MRHIIIERSGHETDGEGDCLDERKVPDATDAPDMGVLLAPSGTFQLRPLLVVEQGGTRDQY